MLSDIYRIITENLPKLLTALAFFSAVMLIVIRISLNSFAHKRLKQFEQSQIAKNEILGQKAKDSYKKEVEVIEAIWLKVHDIHKLCGSIEKESVEQHENLHEMLLSLEEKVHFYEPYLTVKTLTELERFIELAWNQVGEKSFFQEITSARLRIINEFRDRLIVDEC